MNTILQDLRYALRQLRRAPGFALIAIATLALGIGANTAIFSLLDQALLRSLPVRDPQRLIILQGTGDAWEGGTHSHGGSVESYFSYPMYEDLRDRNEAFDGLIATTPADIGVVHAGQSQNARAEVVSGNYFTVLGVQPALGRLFTQADDLQPNVNPIAVLSFDFWKNHLGADPSIVGSAISINGHPFQVAGVAAPRFRSAVWGEAPAVFAPLQMIDQIIPGMGGRLTNHKDRSINLIGRLKSDESRAQAEVALAPLWHSLRADELKALGTRSKHFVDEFLTRSRLLVLPGATGFSYARDDYRAPLLLISAMAALILLIASVNVASLLLVRSAGRRREFAMRFALGAQSARILRQLLLEGLLIGIPGGLAGMLLAPMILRALLHRLNGDQAYGAFIAAIDSRILLFSVASTLAVSILFSLAPAFQLRRPDLTLATRQQSGTGAPAKLAVQRAVVCLQIGLSVVLLLGAGLFVRTMQNLRHVDVGFNTAHLVTFGINPKLSGYALPAFPALQQRLIDAMKTLPGVQSVAATTVPELANDDTGGNVTVSGYNAPPEENFDIEEPFINPDYFATLQIPLTAGRLFTEDDNASHPNVGIVNQSFANHFCGSAPACVGRMMAKGAGNKLKFDTQIVGVVRDAKHTGVREPVTPTWFRPVKQDPNPGELFLYLRTYSNPGPTLTTVRRAVQQFDPNLTFIALRTMEMQIDDELSNERMISLLAVAFGALATLLTAIGLYGVLAYTTTQRTREMGIRIALGSTRAAVVRLVLVDVLMLAAIGVAVAIPLALVTGRLLRSELFGVSTSDPLTFAAVIVLIASVGLVAAWLPARRAAHIDPMQALRDQ